MMDLTAQQEAGARQWAAVLGVDPDVVIADAQAASRERTRTRQGASLKALDELEARCQD